MTFYCLYGKNAKYSRYAVAVYEFQPKHIKRANPSLFMIIFSLFKQSLQFYNKNMWKNVHPVYGAGIWTHNLQDMSLLP